MKKSTLILKAGCLVVFPFTETLLELLYGRRAAQTPLVKPIIVIGSNRSGTSLLYSLLANHPDSYAPSSLTEHFPHHPFSASLLRRILGKSNPVYHAVPQTTGVVAGGRFPPSEVVSYWEEHLGSWGGGWANAPDDYFSDEDLDDDTREILPLDLKKRIFIMHRKRLLIKQPGFSYKIKYLNALFPDAIFVHSVRHPISNFASIKDRKVFHNDPDWGFRILGRETDECSPDVLEARELVRLYETIQRDIRQIENGARRYVPVRYENLQTEFVPEVERLFRACELEPPPVVVQNPDWFVRRKNSQGVRREGASDPQARQILEQLAQQMGYPASPHSGAQPGDLAGPELARR